MQLHRRSLSEESIATVLLTKTKLEKMSEFNSVIDYKGDKELFDLIIGGVDALDLEAIYEQIKYQGFNRGDYLKAALKVMSPSTMIKVAMIGAVRGSNFKKISSSPNIPADVKMLMDNGVIINAKATKTSDVTITRCTAALPQWSSYSLLKAGVPARLSKSDLPACLQFPAAGSLPMSRKVRIAHIEFSAQFSRLIGGVFKTTIYKAMYNDTVSVASIPADVLTVLGVRADSDNVVEIDDLLKDYVEEEEMVSEDEVALKGKRKRSRRA